MKKIALTLSLLAGLPLALSAQVTKEDLKKLAAAGISDEVILSYVKANGPVVKLSAEDVIELKQAGASEKVLSVVLSSPAPAAPSEYKVEKPYAPTSTTTYVYDSTPYYYPSSYYYTGYSPYYPYYYSSYCYPRYSYCYPSFSIGFYGGRYWGGCSSRGFHTIRR